VNERLCPGCRSLDGVHDFGATCTLVNRFREPATWDQFVCHLRDERIGGEELSEYAHQPVDLDDLLDLAAQVGVPGAEEYADTVAEKHMRHGAEMLDDAAIGRATALFSALGSVLKPVVDAVAPRLVNALLEERLRTLLEVLRRPDAASPAWRADAEEAAARVVEIMEVARG
jgi:hypothetical protein